MGFKRVPGLDLGGGLVLPCWLQFHPGLQWGADTLLLSPFAFFWVCHEFTWQHIGLPTPLAGVLAHESVWVDKAVALATLVTAL